MSHVAYPVSPVTYHLSLTPTASSTLDYTYPHPDLPPYHDQFICPCLEAKGQMSGTMCGKAKGVSWWMESPRESQGQNLRGCRPQGLWLRDFPRDSMHHDTPNAFPHMLLFCNPGPVKRDFLHCHQNQPAPREYHTQYYVVEVQTLGLCGLMNYAVLSSAQQTYYCSKTKHVKQSSVSSRVQQLCFGSFGLTWELRRF